jgi:hypothetical protein
MAPSLVDDERCGSCGVLELAWEAEPAEVRCQQRSVLTWDSSDFDWGLSGTVRLRDVESEKDLLVLAEAGPTWTGLGLLWLLQEKLRAPRSSGELPHNEGLWSLIVKRDGERVEMVETVSGVQVKTTLSALARAVSVYLVTMLDQLRTLFPAIVENETFRNWESELPVVKGFLSTLAGQDL